MAGQAAELKMPQAGGVQREPSMEEILASIRRIIEDSDDSRKPAAAEAAPVAEAKAAAVAETPAPEAQASPAPVAQSNPAPAAPAAISRPRETVAEAKPAPQPEQRPAAPAASAAPAGEPRAQAPAPRTEPAARTEAAKPAPAEPKPAMPSAQDVPLGEMDMDIEATLSPVAANADERPARARTPAALEKSSLISERTGRQVAAAFGELSEAFEASRRKSFDELASEMMRPMLQDWLDNNLPTLVEKLVREEIERVARGVR